jgi:hypothetical protein
LSAGNNGGEPPVPVLWPRTHTIPSAYELACSGLLVPPDCRLPGGWKISASEYAIPPLPVSVDL